MIASIYSYDEEKRSLDIKTAGKTMTVNSSKLDFKFDDGKLNITAQDSEYYRPQDTVFSRSPIRDIQRKLTLELTSDDLLAILNAALDAKLIRAAFTVNPIPAET